MEQTLFGRALHSPFGFQLVCLTFLFAFLLSFKPSFLGDLERFEPIVFSESQKTLRVLEPGFLENSVGVNTAGLRQIIVEDAEGKKVIMKKRDSTIFYIVKPGDSIWTIAHKLGLKPQTVLWANDLTAISKIGLGDKLTIPPIDGVYYTVQSRDTLGEVAKAHHTDIQKVRSYNGLSRDIIKSGQKLFIPGAERIYIAEKPTIKYSNNTYRAPKSSTTSGSINIGSIGFDLIRPTRGTLTQGFKRGHYALDIASKLNTPVYASAGGTVTVSKDGWNYGYGNYIIIDHGNGVETLYGHNNIRKVREGDTVKAGQLIALMGNSGRVFGVTGIHVHFELRIRGRKVNPYNYFQ